MTPKSAEKLRDRCRSIQGARILVAEDDSVNQLVIAQFLKLSGLEPMIAGNGREVLDLLMLHSFDAILMDLHMPVMDGGEATRRIRSNPAYAHIPVIALTGGLSQHEKDSIVVWKPMEMNEYISKPVDVDQLIAVLCRMVKLERKN